MHRVLRKLYRLGADDILMPEDDAVAEYHREWEKLDLTTLQVTSDYYTVDDYIRIGEKRPSRLPAIITRLMITFASARRCLFAITTSIVRSIRVPCSGPSYT
jgi:hypothetical protein